MSSEPKKRRSYCRRCRNKTWQTVAVECEFADVVEIDESEDFRSYVRSLLLVCAGCNETSLLKMSWNDNYSYPDRAEESLFPPAMYRHPPAWSDSLREPYQALLREIYESLAGGALALPVMGARTILDTVIRDLVGDQGTFEKGLKQLAEAGLLSGHDSGSLEAAIDAGSAAAHRGYRPELGDVEIVLDITEHLLQSHFVLPPAADQLRERTPQRERPPKPSEISPTRQKAPKVE